MESSILLTCELHKRHAPNNLTLELHHIIPVAWQLTWQPTVAPYPGKDPNGRGMLWDSRTLACCPTGHRNVHFWIVRIMHALAGAEDPTAAEASVGESKGGPQAKWGLEALLRFKAVGGSLQQLVAAHEFGQV